MAIADAACLAGASPHELKLVETALDSLFIAGKSEKLIGGKAYDSDKLDDDLLKKHSVELTAPHRRNQTKPKTQDGRKLRRHQRRWKIERLFARLLNFRRLVVRYERHTDNFSAFSLFACSIILLHFFEIGSRYLSKIRQFYAWLSYRNGSKFRRYSSNARVS